MTSTNNRVSNFIEQTTDDVETLFSGAAGAHWEFEYLQMTTGPLDAWMRIVPLPDMTIHWYRYSAALHAREYHRYDGLFLTFLLSAQGAVKWRGIELASRCALLYFPEQFQDYVLPKHIRSIGFMISNRLIQRMDWHICKKTMRLLNQPALQATVTEVEKIARRLCTNKPLSREYRYVMQERLALHLDKLLAPWMTGHSGHQGVVEAQPDKYHRLAEAARHELLRWNMSDKLDVQHLATLLCTSPRTLYRAFQHCYGVGPYEYYTLMRFRAFRNMLRSIEIRPGAITETATEAGFLHLGRFASSYYKHYGELPKDSLRRWLQDGN